MQLFKTRLHRALIFALTNQVALVAQIDFNNLHVAYMLTDMAQVRTPAPDLTWEIKLVVGQIKKRGL